MTMETYFYSVSTPGYFREIELPSEDETWTDEQKREYEKLEDDAERCGTLIRVSAYRLG